jgi:hypothetical protein
MKITTKTLQLIVKAMALAAVIYMILAAPGVLSDRDSIVPDRLTLESRR